jgi:hypothetical protein
MEKTKRSPQEILSRIESVKDDDWMGTQVNDLLFYLPFAEARPHLKEGVTADQWAEATSDVKPALDAARDYLDFAWDKANNCRGLSAGRSLDHMKAWLWLAGYDKLVDEHFGDYEHYGKFQLVIASELTGFDWRAHDNGEWVNGEDRPSLDPSEINDLAAEAKRIAEEHKQR